MTALNVGREYEAARLFRPVVHLIGRASTRIDARDGREDTNFKRNIIFINALNFDPLFITIEI